MKLLMAIAPAVLLMVYGQLVIKWRVQALFDPSESAPAGMARLVTYVSDPLIISAYLTSLAASVAWMFVVERYALSIAFPLYIGLTVIAVSIGGVVLFGETMTGTRMLAIVLIVAGVAIGARG